MCEMLTWKIKSLPTCALATDCAMLCYAGNLIVIAERSALRLANLKYLWEVSLRPRLRYAQPAVRPFLAYRCQSVNVMRS